MGTSFKGAYDDVEKITNLLKPILEKNKLYTRKVEYAPGKFDERTGYWIHIDGALGASYLPFLDKAQDRIKEHVPKFDFALPLVHSIVTSAHKFPGCPMPSGIYMTKRKYQIAPPDDPEYIGSPDTTFAGSRNAISPAVLWCYYANTNDEIEIEKVLKVEDTAKYAERKLKELEQEYQNSGYKLWVYRAPLSLAIIFRDPENRDTISKYSLSQMKVQIDGEKEPRKYAHIFIMASVTKELIDKLVEDLKHAYDQMSSSKQENTVEKRRSVPNIDGKRSVQRIGHVPLDNRGLSGN
jgi:histidine decarboxylase